MPWQYRQALDVRELVMESDSAGEFRRVVDMATRRHTGELFVNRDAVHGSIYSGAVYWRQASSAHYFITPVPGKVIVSLLLQIGHISRPTCIIPDILNYCTLNITRASFCSIASLLLPIIAVLCYTGFVYNLTLFNEYWFSIWLLNSFCVMRSVFVSVNFSFLTFDAILRDKPFGGHIIKSLPAASSHYRTILLVHCPWCCGCPSRSVHGEAWSFRYSATSFSCCTNTNNPPPEASVLTSYFMLNGTDVQEWLGTDVLMKYWRIVVANR